MSHDADANLRYKSEREFFDKQSADRQVTAMPQHFLDRYAETPQASVFGKEMMFQIMGDKTGKRLLELGCGEGQTSVQLAYCGADVTGLDISDRAIEAAKLRTELTGLTAKYMVANLETDELGDSEYDIVLCDMILHHVVPMMDNVLEKVHRALKPGGLFVCREPIAYAKWLKTLRGMMPVKQDITPDEQPLRQSELDIIKKYFPKLNSRYFRILGRVNLVTQNLGVLAAAGRIDNVLFKIPGSKSLAGDVLIWAKKPMDG